MDGSDDGRMRTGTLWMGVAHTFTASIGSGVLALPWSMAQLGWILGPLVNISFAVITYYTAILLCECYRTPDPVSGRRNYTYMDALEIQCSNFTKSGFHGKGQSARCEVPGNLYMLMFGAFEVILSQCPNLEKAAFLSVVAAVTSLVYSVIVIGLSTEKLISSNLDFKGSLMVAHDHSGTDRMASSTKIWHVFQALGNIAFAFSYNTLLLEIQDTLKSPPPENKVMKKVTLWSIGGTSLFYISIACTTYAAYGNEVPGNILSTFSNLVWLVDIANLAVIVHLIGAYQVYTQPVFATHEGWPASLTLNRRYVHDPSRDDVPILQRGSWPYWSHWFLAVDGVLSVDHVHGSSKDQERKLYLDNLPSFGVWFAWL
ncbi:hypothetical protein JRO89_XS07G0267500 [Xanthoceras sorbifolium]|uniref:Amino acid transporter transmembrane domain-containing protein n=1 Tax=Xanthoceras sorbifolium TaxID=99658 RepID=A0ABQ8HV81_9ROSI|nr:hypothetical protein JRO89_XS07G0267500 [Xanthoceras sorbifolium]